MLDRFFYSVVRAKFVFVVILFFFHQETTICKTAHLNKYAKPGADVTVVLQELVNTNSTVVIDEGVWLLSGEIRLRSFVTIKGVGPEKSVIKRNINSPLKGGMMFYTEKAYTDSYINKDPVDEYSPQKVKFRNIIIENLSIDFNRSPHEYNDEQLKKYNLYGIALIRTSNALVKQCCFKDYMTERCNNGYPAIVVYQSDRIWIENNINYGVTFAQIIFSKNIKVSGNNCISSVGTAIEFIAGTNHQCIDNVVKKVFWKVSCVGINSTNSIVRGNLITATDNNISCLTLGHEPFLFRADSTVAEKNILHSSGCRGVLIQNGCCIVVKNNKCSCIISKGAPELTTGCIVASGKSDGIYGLVIVDNILCAPGDGNSGCITYRGTGRLMIKDNVITAKRGINILSADNCNSEIVANSITSSDYTISANCPQLKISKNTLTDGIIANSREIEITDNVICYSNHYTFLCNRWDKVKVTNNLITNKSNKELKYAFLFDGSEKSEEFDVSKVVMCGNKVREGIVKEMIAISGGKRAPQLKQIANN